MENDGIKLDRRDAHDLWQDDPNTRISGPRKRPQNHTCDPDDLIVSHHDIEVIGMFGSTKTGFYDFGATYVVWTGAGYVIKKRVDKHHALCLASHIKTTSINRCGSIQLNAPEHGRDHAAPDVFHRQGLPPLAQSFHRDGKTFSMSLRPHPPRQQQCHHLWPFCFADHNDIPIIDPRLNH